MLRDVLARLAHGVIHCSLNTRLEASCKVESYSVGTHTENVLLRTPIYIELPN